jgi:hypothetical protein
MILKLGEVVVKGKGVGLRKLTLQGGLRVIGIKGYWVI